MIKKQIDALLEQILTYQERTNYSLSGTSIPSLCNELQSALESGALDCLVEHPASEPPDDNRNVLVLITWRVRRMAYFEHGKWLVYGLDGLYRQEYIKSWQELPLASEVKK